MRILNDFLIQRKTSCDACLMTDGERGAVHDNVWVKYAAQSAALFTVVRACTTSHHLTSTCWHAHSQHLTPVHAHRLFGLEHNCVWHGNVIFYNYTKYEISKQQLFYITGGKERDNNALWAAVLGVLKWVSFMEQMDFSCPEGVRGLLVFIPPSNTLNRGLSGQ